tara:strand:+ start:365 stop:862 length:498 start_codon:yes stop_codon:yes gene_type:complete
MLLLKVVFIVLIFLLHFSIYTWTNKLEEEKCNCSDLWHRNIVNKLAVGLFCLCLLGIILSLHKGKYLEFYKLAYKLLFIIYILIIIDYIRKLKRKNCECSEDWRRQYGYFFSISWLILIVLVMIGLKIYYDNKLAQYKSIEKELKLIEKDIKFSNSLKMKKSSKK